MNLGKRQARDIVRRLKEVRRDAAMPNASLSPAKHKWSHWTDEFTDNEDFTAMVKERTENYRSTWLLAPLDSLIEELESFT